MDISDFGQGLDRQHMGEWVFQEFQIIEQQQKEYKNS